MPETVQEVLSDCSDAVAVFEGTAEEVQVHSQILRIASPVFNGMLNSEMKEASTKRIRIGVASKAAFLSFYQCLLPGAVYEQHLSKQNVDGILELSDYYQIEFLTDACIRILRECPASIARLIRAKKLESQHPDLYHRFLTEIMASKCKYNLEDLSAHSDILLDMVKRVPDAPSELKELKPYVEKLHSHIGKRPCTERFDGVAAKEMYDCLGKLRRLM
mmetsp:Transcript_41653/g.116015  ORF Transcript_41653/g.116015 Transcript_41653/m.116015 type:complete len:218 (-) Transcript_41653:80-733(-)